MSELLQAAKAVIDNWDCVSHARLGFYIEELRDAVERSEKQEAVGFYEWWQKQGPKYCWDSYTDTARTAWTAAQQAERERIKEIVGKLSTSKDPWIYSSTLLEKIDASEDS